MFSVGFDVERSITIDRPASDVFEMLGDLGKWQGWSPWLIQEPGCPLVLQGTPKTVGHSQRWDGKIIGSGELRIKAIEPNKLVDCELTFFKPWRSQSKCAFMLESQGATTKVTWTMHGTLPPFLFFLKKTMIGFIGSDYERGLSMLKERLEKGSVPSRLESKGEVKARGFHWIGKSRACATSEMTRLLQEDFRSINELVAKGQLPKPVFGMTFYKKFDIANGRSEYTAAMAYSEDPKVKIPSGLEAGRANEHSALRIDHVGPYRFLGNGWSAAIGSQRMMNRKSLRSVPMYEIYRTMPGEVPETDVHTEIYVPLS